jgi:hypothetical protein
MPRKIRPKYGIDPVQEVPAFSFNDTEAERALNALGALKANRDDVIVHLQECARAYLWRRNQNQEEPTRAQQNAALKEVAHLAREHGNGLRNLEMRLHSLDMGTEFELLTRFPALHRGDFADAIENASDVFSDLARAAEDALQAGQQSGPRIQTHVRRAVVELAKLYEKFTGERFSHNPKELTKYVGRPNSRAGRFIIAFFEIVDPNIPPQSLSTAMASIIKAKFAEQKAPTG